MPDEAMTTKGLLLSPETGLIDAPKQIVKGDNYYKYQTGWSVEMLLNGGVEPGSRVKLESRYANGTYFVSKVSHSGDNYSGNWTTKAEVLLSEMYAY
jgi:hypothetical protein